ncbi:hypothetical protein D2E71_21330 [Mycobacteroides abscessus]|uniref:Uncharacterized protein n=1 Tax=Mycobacteroides immunogenum TaxID=83262 RepID=A0ABR5LM80_9MYCO|nr:hypothetical protein MAUC22_15375 [Mycobacteroides abscessus UC22]KPG28063.1 hypothetical protein AN912_22310 [Mycobacteroides immunogenum]RIR30665.1 hypothetical protein D2E38_22970 [Mycobacteroides abscessus]KPG28755.1 hypothetical protein AN913_12535 [Mycobacteroides immunogenum]KPG60314.1 hypothetical protein AN918_11515 [Mycobacteroides immunogenum]
MGLWGSRRNRRNSNLVGTAAILDGEPVIAIVQDLAAATKVRTLPTVRPNRSAASGGASTDVSSANARSASGNGRPITTVLRVR